MKPLTAQQLRHQITIQSRSTSQDATGGQVDTWSTVATVWAAIEPLQGREFFAAQQVQAETSVRIRMRYLAGVLPSMRVVFDSTIYDIKDVIDPEMKHRELHLMCSTGVTRG